MSDTTPTGSSEPLPPRVSPEPTPAPQSPLHREAIIVQQSPRMGLFVAVAAIGGIGIGLGTAAVLMRPAGPTQVIVRGDAPVTAVAPQIVNAPTQRTWLGVHITTVHHELDDVLGLNTRTGARVISVFDGSPARRAHFREGDIVVKFNGQDIASSEDLVRAVIASRPGTSLPIMVIRSGELQVLYPTLAMAPPGVFPPDDGRLLLPSFE